MIFNLKHDNRTNSNRIFSITPATNVYMYIENNHIVLKFSENLYDITCYSEGDALSLLQDIDNANTYNKIDHPQIFI